MISGRLDAPAGALIDRDQTVEFSFDGKRYTGFAGDTIASALLANGVSMLSRSFKYHRPRGVLTAAGQDDLGGRDDAAVRHHTGDRSVICLLETQHGR